MSRGIVLGVIDLLLILTLLSFSKYQYQGFSLSLKNKVKFGTTFECMVLKSQTLGYLTGCRQVYD